MTALVVSANELFRTPIVSIPIDETAPVGMVSVVVHGLTGLNSATTLRQSMSTAIRDKLWEFLKSGASPLFPLILTVTIDDEQSFIYDGDGVVGSVDHASLELE